MSSQGREHLRFDARIPVRFSGKEEFLTEYTKNISMGGVFVRMRKPVKYGARVKLALEPPGTTEAIEVMGKVVFVVTPEIAEKEGKEPGIGVRFEQMTDAARDALSECVRNLSHSHAGRVLVVDNDGAHVKELSGMLREMRFNVVTVASAIKGLDILWRQPFDLILAAVSMPRMDGLEFRDTLRRDPDAASIPFILVSSGEEEEDLETAERLGVKHFLRKPVTPKALQEATGTVLPETKKAQPQAVPQKTTSSAVHRARFNEVAYKKMTALGVAARFTPDEKAVTGELTLEHVDLVDIFSKAPISMVWVENDGPDHVRITQPALLSNLGSISILPLADQEALEQAIYDRYHEHRMIQGKGTELLKRWQISPEFQQWRFRVVGRVVVGRDEITFSFRDVDSLIIEAINSRDFPTTAALQPRLVFIRQVETREDLEHVIAGTVKRNRKQLEELLPEERDIAGIAPPEVITSPAAEAATGGALAQPPSYDDLFGADGAAVAAATGPPPAAAMPAEEPVAPAAAVAIPNPEPEYPEEESAGFVCSTCGNKYDPGEDLEDERLLLQCADCLGL